MPAFHLGARPPAERGLQDRMDSRMKRLLRRSIGVLALGATLLAAGCATPTASKAPETGPVFFGDPPRIQLLATFRGEADFGKESSDIVKFVAGEQRKGRVLRQPYGSAVFEGRLYVVDTKAAGYAVFDLANRKFSFVEGFGNGRMVKPINITFDADGTRYITDTGKNQVLVFDRNDKFVQAFGAPGQFKPVDVAIAGDRLYVVDIEHNEVQVLDKRSGRTLFTFGKIGTKEGELFHPTNLAIGPEGDVYVVETSNFRVQRFTSEGKHVRFYGDLGQTPGSFARPKGIAIDRQGRLYVGDSAFQNIQIFTNDGRMLLSFGEGAPGREGLNLPTGVSIDYGSVELFKRHADPKFSVEYVITVASQFEPNKVDVFGFGRMAGATYADEGKAAAAR